VFDQFSTSSTQVKFLPGALVEVKAEREILATLDENGTFEKLPFMPEMLKFCGRQFRVSRQAFKTCVDDQEMRQLDHTVLLEEVRCDGSSHGGCGRACLIFWKEPWLNPVTYGGGHKMQPELSGCDTKAPMDAGCSANSRREPGITADGLTSQAVREGKFFCQSSEILNASSPLPWWQLRQYVWDLRYNRVSIVKWLESLFIAFYNKIAFVAGLKSWKFMAGTGAAKHEPSLNLMPGELVRVKSLAEIRQTLDEAGKHMNLLFAPAMADFCGTVLRVQERLENIVLEGTSRQRKIKDTVLLEGATCDGICHRMCPRQSFLFWRECWLERV
jgi:hypothetical protein